MDTSMATPDILNSPHVAKYFTGADRRVMIGLRACLELLGIPLPAYAQRRYPGPTPARAALAAFHADHASTRPNVLADRKPNASPDRIAAMQAARATSY